MEFQQLPTTDISTMEVKETCVTFKSLGVVDVLCEACELLKWKSPTDVQREAIPVALKGRDIIGVSETGSGKTGAFAIPILQTLLKRPQPFFGLVLSPTRELAFQVSEVFEKLGSSMGLKIAVTTGGFPIIPQIVMLAKKPHIMIATPGRLVEHLTSTKGFNLKALKFLVLDEADQMLKSDFAEDVDKILKAIPKQRTTYLYSATMTNQVKKLQRASLVDPVKIQVSRDFGTVQNLQQYYLFIPLIHKDVYLVHVLQEHCGKSIMVFCATCANTQRIALMLRNLGLNAIALYGQLSQEKRLGALGKFKAKRSSILVATDVASRGLDIEGVDVVIVFDIPTHYKDYIHRVGRTARAKKSGKAITFTTQYDVEHLQTIEYLIDKKFPEYETDAEQVMAIKERVAEAQRSAKLALKEIEAKNRKGKRRKNGSDDDDTEEAKGVRNRFKKKKFKSK